MFKQEDIHMHIKRRYCHQNEKNIGVKFLIREEELTTLFGRYSFDYKLLIYLLYTFIVLLAGGGCETGGKRTVLTQTQIEVKNMVRWSFLKIEQTFMKRKKSRDQKQATTPCLYPCESLLTVHGVTCDQLFTSSILF